jgi:hypothetical protein
MQFRVEKEMAEPVESWLNNNGYSVKREFSTAWGICDIVAAKPYKTHILHRIHYKQKKPLRSARKINILDVIPDKRTGESISFKNLSNNIKFYSCHDQLLRDLTELEKDNFIICTKQNHYQKLNGWLPLHKQILTVELKLNRISEAVFQAKNNLKFTSQSYVALPYSTSLKIANSSKANYFINAGIGLIGVLPSGCKVFIKATAPISESDSLIQTLYAERFWEVWLKGN